MKKAFSMAFASSVLFVVVTLFIPQLAIAGNFYGTVQEISRIGTSPIMAIKNTSGTTMRKVIDDTYLNEILAIALTAMSLEQQVEGRYDDSTNKWNGIQLWNN